MADLTNSITITFKGINNQLQGSIKGVNSSFLKLHTSISGLQASTKAFTASARKGFLLVAAAITATLVPFSKFEDGMTNVKTLLSGTNEEVSNTIGLLEELAKDTLRNTSFAIKDVTEALFFLVSTTAEVELQNERFKESVRLAEGGVTSLTIAVNAVTGALNAYKGSSLTAEQVSNAFFVAQKFGATTVQELALNLGKVLPFAKRASFRFDEIAASVSTLTKAGIDTTIASTALRQVIASLLNPTEDAMLAFMRLKIPFGELGLKGKNLGDIMLKIATAIKDGKAETSDFFKNIRAQLGVFDITALEEYDMILKEIRSDTVSLDRAVAEQQKRLSFNLGKLRNSFSLIAITLGERMAPEIIEASIQLRKFSRVIDEVEPKTINTIAQAILKLAVALGGLVIAGTVASALLSVAKVLAIIGVIVTSPSFLGIATVIGGITIAMKKFQDTKPVIFLKDFGNALLKATKAWFEWDRLKKEFGFGGEAKKEESKNFLSFLDDLKAAVVDLGDTWKNMEDELSKPLLPTEEGGDKPSIKDETDKIKEEVEEVGINIVKVFGYLEESILTDWEATISGLLQGTKTFGDAVMGIFGGIGRAFANLIAEIAASNLFRFGISLLTGNPFAFALPSFAVGSSNVPQDMMANIHKGEIITPARESQGIRDGNLALVNTSKLQGQSNNLLESLVSKVDVLAERPITVVADFGEAQMDIFSRQVDKADSRREEFLI